MCILTIHLSVYGVAEKKSFSLIDASVHCSSSSSQFLFFKFHLLIFLIFFLMYVKVYMNDENLANMKSFYNFFYFIALN